MDALDSHLESITFNLISTIRPWIGVIAAALGIFKVRFTGSSLSSSVTPCTLEPDILETPVEAPTTSQSSSTVVGDIRYGCGITKGRFTVYYEEDNNENLKVNDHHETIWATRISFDMMNYDAVERVVKMRMGDGMGWYRSQDLTVVSGNVVKLWDGGCSSTTFKHMLCGTE